jgi:hypothetical protein
MRTVKLALQHKRAICNRAIPLVRFIKLYFTILRYRQKHGISVIDLRPPNASAFGIDLEFGRYGTAGSGPFRADRRQDNDHE